MKILKKNIQIVIFTLVVILIFAITYTHMLKDVNKLPSDRWSKEIELFEIDRENDGLEYNKNYFEFLRFNDSLICFYSKSNTLKFKRYDMSFNLIDEGDILTAEEDIKNIYASSEGENITVILEKNLILDFYTISSNLDLVSEDNSYELKTNNFDIENGFVITQNENGFSLLSGKSQLPIELAGDYYSVKSSLKHINDEIMLTYVTLIEEKPTVVLSIYNNNGETKENIIISRLIHTQKKFDLVDLISYLGTDTTTVMVRVNDKRNQTFYLDYFKYSFDLKKIVYSDDFTNIRDIKNAANEGEIIYTVRGEDISDSIGERYLKSKNLAIANIEESNFELLTRTKMTPIKHIHFSNDDNNYLVWNESSDGITKVFYSSDSSKIINTSRKYTSDKLKLAFYELINTSVISVYTVLIIGSMVIISVFMFIIPLYFINISYVERNWKKLLISMFIIHNIVVFIIHNSLKSNVDFPLFLDGFLPISMLIINFLAIYSYVYFKSEKKLNDIIIRYISFCIPYIFIYSSLISPYILIIS